MAMSETALAEKIKRVMLEIREETENPDESMETFCNKLAKAIVEEVRKMSITATCSHGSVSVLNIS
ncbi:MAG: hypothetical protein Q4A00_05560 [Flavobacteriaceae bacterium]|nr:hypothetical protein [Flavobacteriaceae bacterium]